LEGGLGLPKHTAVRQFGIPKQSTEGDNMNDNSTAVCSDCGDSYSKERWRLGYYTCQTCGEEYAARVRSTWCIAPLNKSNYVLITERAMLAQLNPKRTT